MFSTRTGWDRTPNLFGPLFDEARRREPCFDLTESNPTRVGIAYPENEILAALSNSALLRYEPDPRGLFSARQAVAAHSARSGVTVDPEDIVLTASTSEAYAFLFKTLCDAGDNVVALAPSYPLFDDLARLESIELRTHPLLPEPGFSLDIEALETELDEKTRAILVVTPGNPTGVFLRHEELTALLGLCKRRGLALISDEVFASYAYAEDPARAPSLASPQSMALGIALSGFSKLLALPQLKLGWMVLSGPSELKQEARERLELVSDTYLSVSTQVQLAAPALFELVPRMSAMLRERVLENRRTLEAARSESSTWSLLSSQAGASAVLKIPTHPGESEQVMALARAGVLVHPGHFFEFQRGAHLVVSLLPEPPVFKAGFERIMEALRVG